MLGVLASNAVSVHVGNDGTMWQSKNGKLCFYQFIDWVGLEIASIA